MTITGPGAKYIRTIWAPKALFNLLLNEEVISIVGHTENGYLITVCGAGPIPSNTGDTPPIFNPPVAIWPTPNTISNPNP